MADIADIVNMNADQRKRIILLSKTPLGVIALKSQCIGLEQPVRFADKDLDPDGRWVTVSGNHIHIDSKGDIDAGGPQVLRDIMSGGKSGKSPEHQTMEAMAEEWKNGAPKGDHSIIEKMLATAKDKGWGPLSFVDAMHKDSGYAPTGEVSKKIDDLYDKYEGKKYPSLAKSTPAEQDQKKDIADRGITPGEARAAAMAHHMQGSGMREPERSDDLMQQAKKLTVLDPKQAMALTDKAMEAEKEGLKNLNVHSTLGGYKIGDGGLPAYKNTKEGYVGEKMAGSVPVVVGGNKVVLPGYPGHFEIKGEKTIKNGLGKTVTVPDAVQHTRVLGSSPVKDGKTLEHLKAALAGDALGGGYRPTKESPWQVSSSSSGYVVHQKDNPLAADRYYKTEKEALGRAYVKNMDQHRFDHLKAVQDAANEGKTDIPASNLKQYPHVADRVAANVAAATAASTAAPAKEPAKYPLGHSWDAGGDQKGRRHMEGWSDTRQQPRQDGRESCQHHE